MSTEAQRKLRREAQARYRAAHPEQCRARQKAHHAANAERISAQRSARYAADPQKHRDRQKGTRERTRDTRRHAYIKRVYGIGPEQFEALRTAQGDACAICAEAFTNTPRVDHCHATGVVRGLLCDGCNIAVGHFKDDPNRMEAGARYMRARQPQTLKLIATSAA